MKVTFWGVRGSLSSFGPDTLRYGGNTSCMRVEHNDGHTIVLDAGTGLRALGDMLLKKGQEHDARQSCLVVLSHGHWDHIVGLPFFRPLFHPQWDVTICALKNIGGCGLKGLLGHVFNPALFPVPWHELQNKLHLVELEPGQVLENEGARLTLVEAHHTQGAAACRVEGNGHSLFYSGDHELGTTLSPLDTPFFQAMRGADMAIVDGTYSYAEYRQQRQGWGHSAQEQWLPLADALGVGTLVFTHFNIHHTDEMLDDARQSLETLFPHINTRFTMAYEGLELSCVPPHRLAVPSSPPCLCCEASKQFLHLSEMGQIFDALLSKTRALTHADAGTLYLVEEGRLVFAYSQNETLYSASEWARQQYLNAILPIDATSIAGFVALHQSPLVIEDVRQLPSHVPYSFNSNFDEVTGYLTKSMCVIPLCSVEGTLMGVLQLINCTRDGRVLAFSTRMQRLATDLCQVGAYAIERGQRMQDMILRMLQTATLRDPTETGGHVMRVGAMVAELYQKWGEGKGLTMHDMRERKAHLRLAAMLHDVGKVGIADAILKKPGRLNPEERAEMETHSSKGAQLFGEPRSEVDTLARNIALHHHQKWDGSGYTGDPDVPLLSGTDIPLEARLTAIADVFDALVSPRCYKEPWPVEKALEVLQKDAGTHFDPELVDVFMEIQTTMTAIRAKYQG